MYSKLRVGIILSINRITKKITNFAIKITLSYGDSHITVSVSCRPDVIACRPNVIYRFNSINHKIYRFLSFSIIFDKFIIYYRFYHFLSDFNRIFIVYYWISIKFLLNSFEFYRFRTIGYVRGIL